MALEEFSDADATRTIARAIRLVGALTLVVTPLLWWRMGWASAALFVVGAGISAASLWKWLRLMAAALARMSAGDAAQAENAATTPVEVRPMGPVLMGFFLTLGLSVVVLYASLKYLEGSVFALAAGLAMGVFALTLEALRLVKAWTV